LVSPARVAVAVISFSAGAFPLVYYNAVTGGATLHTGNVMSGSAPLSQKLLILEKAMDGSVLFGWLTEDAQPETALAPIRPVAKLSVYLTRATGSLRRNWMLFVFLGSCCLLPWLWFTPARRASLFALVYLAVAWGQMVMVPNTGATLHHVILLWPFPHFLIAIAGAQLFERLGTRGRRALAAAFVAIAGSNALVVNHLYSDLLTRGTTVIWTDAVYPLFRYLDTMDHYQFVTVDWGYATTLCVLSDGQAPMRDISYTLLNPSDAETAFIRSLMIEARTLFVDHTAGGQQFPGVRERMARIAASAGYTRNVVQVIKDRNGRPRFEIAEYAEGRP
jgi:hypothetical protein